MFRWDYKDILTLLNKLRLADTETLRDIIFFDRWYKAIYPKLKKLSDIWLIEIMDMPAASSNMNNFYTLSPKKENMELVSQIIWKEVSVKPIKSTYFLFNHTKMIWKVLWKITKDFSKKMWDEKFDYISNFISETDILESIEKVKYEIRSQYIKKIKYHPKPDWILKFKNKTLLFEVELSKSLAQWREKCHLYMDFLNYYNENNSSPLIDNMPNDLILVVGLYSYKKDWYMKIMKEIGLDKVIRVLWVDLDNI